MGSILKKPIIQYNFVLFGVVRIIDFIHIFHDTNLINKFYLEKNSKINKIRSSSYYDYESAEKTPCLSVVEKSRKIVKNKRVKREKKLCDPVLQVICVGVFASLECMVEGKYKHLDFFLFEK